MAQRIYSPNGPVTDRFGEVISLDGDTVLIGAQQLGYGSLIDAGAAYIYRNVGGTWVEEAELMPSDPAEYQRFGRRVSLDGDVALVGVPLYDCADGESCGAVYVFRFDGTDWIEEVKLTDPEAAANDLFGDSVSVNGDAALIGARQTDCPSGANCGVAYVFRFDGSSWVQEARLSRTNPIPGINFGNSVSLGTDIAVVGAAGIGATYVFRFDGIDWNETAVLTSPDGVPSDDFGRAVVLQGNTLVVTSYDTSNCGTVFGCGAGYVFGYDAGTWHFVKKLVASDAAEASFFGYIKQGVAIGGDKVAVGAHRADCSADRPKCGAVYTSILEGPDCDDDGALDVCELLDGSAQDCNGNDFPDNCEPGGSDEDGDGVLDPCDICPGHDDFLDDDDDGVPNGCDGCPDDENKVDPGQCGCGQEETDDSDGDGVSDCVDLCPDVDDAVFAPECAGAIPAVSQWGLIVLAMLLLIAAKLSFGRRVKRVSV